MLISHRKARPLTRETSDYRDDRLFIVACDDTYAPAQYFEFFRIERVKIHVVPTTNTKSHAQYVLDNLMGIECREDDELWMILDTDHCIKAGHIRSFIAALREAKKKGINVALSRSCFEVWLLLHHISENEVRNLGSAAEVEAKLKAVLGSYNKTLLDGSHFPLKSVVDAYRRALRLDAATENEMIPRVTTTRVYRFWQSIITGASVSQLPEELRELKMLE